MSSPPVRNPIRRLRFLSRVGEGIRIALDSLRANLFRAGLTILGVGIGVGVVVLMAALITGIRGSVQEGVEAAGPRNFFVTRFDLNDVQLIQTGRPPWWNRPPVSEEETRRANELSAVERAVMSVGVQGSGLIVEFGGIEVTGVAGAAESADWPEYRRVTFVQGRNFIPMEVRAARSVVVLTIRLAQDLFGAQDAVGQRVWMRSGSGSSIPLTVIGVIDPAENLFDDQAAYIAILPYTTGLRRLGISDEWAQMIVVPKDDVAIEEAEDQVIGLLRTMRGLAPGEENTFSILRSTQLLEIFDRLTGVFFIVMLSLSSVGLLVGGVGVLGVMLISVTERTREIGVRKALGATRGEILWQFLVEAGVLTLIGGAIGLLLGGALAWGVATVTPIPARVPLWSVMVSLLMAGLTGMVFGLVPAVRAARMEPVAALRHE